MQLAKIVVATAVLSDRKEDYVTMIQGLSPSSQTEMMNILNEVLVLPPPLFSLVADMAVDR